MIFIIKRVYYIFLLIFFLDLILLSSGSSASLYINEVSPNEPEWVEIRNPGKQEYNLSLWHIKDIETTDSLTCFTRPNCSLIAHDEYFIVLGRNIEISQITNETVPYYYVDDNTIGRGLNNNLEEITFFNSTYNTSMNYSSSTKGLSWSKCLKIWKELAFSPGRVNNCTNTTSKKTNNKSCDLKISIKGGNKIFNSSEKTHFYLNLFDLNQDQELNIFNISYRIEDVFGNVLSGYPKITDMKIQNGKARERKQWTAPSLSGSEVFIIRSEILGVSCNDTNLSNNFFQEMIMVRGSHPTENNVSGIEFADDLSETEKEFGKAVNVKINAYKGDTAKYVIYLWIENSEGKIVSEKSKVYVYDKYTNYTFSVPVLLKPNCDKKYPDGAHRIIMEGLGILKQSEMTIKGISSVNCKEITKTCGSRTITKKCENVQKDNETEESVLEIVQYEDSVSIGEEFRTQVKLINNNKTPVNYTIYSYAFNGSRCASLGFDGNSWKRTWDANKKTLEIPADSSVNVILINSIKNETDPGIYKFRIRMNYDGIENRATLDLIVEEKIRNTTISIVIVNQTIEDEEPVSFSETGMAINENYNFTFPMNSIFSQIVHIFMSIFKF